MNINTFIQEIEDIRVKKEDFFSLGTWLEKQDVSFFLQDVEKIKEKKKKNNYEKIKYETKSQIEVSLVCWPPEISSAIHSHKGFWGYVVVLKGLAKNTRYTYKERKLQYIGENKYKPFDIFSEPDHTIHKISNISKEYLFTLHLYYPKLLSYEGIKIFDIETGRIGVLNAKAESASWKEPKSSFSRIEEDAFVLE